MRLPFVISVPHCSFQIPQEIEDSLALTESEILESTDIGTREVFTHLPVRVALWARWSRIVADLNRDYRQRDPVGVVPEVDYFSRRIYEENYTPDKEEVERRLKRYYWPYHHRLREALEDPETRILFDCHSLNPIGPPGAPDPLKWRKDIILGNNGDSQGKVNPSLGDITCPSEIIQMIREMFEESGFSISVNRPYAGGFITTHYGKELMQRGKMAVQVEINQELYMENAGMRFRQDMLSDIAVRLQQVFREIARRL